MPAGKGDKTGGIVQNARFPGRRLKAGGIQAGNQLSLPAAVFDAGQKTAFQAFPALPPLSEQQSVQAAETVIVEHVDDGNVQPPGFPVNGGGHGGENIVDQPEVELVFPLQKPQLADNVPIFQPAEGSGEFPRIQPFLR